MAKFTNQNLPKAPKNPKGGKGSIGASKGKGKQTV
jgi:hypothetical protein